MDDVGSELDRLARRTGFSGAVCVEANGSVEFAGAYGAADPASGVPNTLETRFGIASGTKGLTALEHLLAHRSGIGDYLDEETVAVDDYVLGVPAHELDSVESYLAVLALAAERAAGVRYDELVAERACRPAGMADTAFLRSDELPGGTAVDT